MEELINKTINSIKTNTNDIFTELKLCGIIESVMLASTGELEIYQINDLESYKADGLRYTESIDTNGVDHLQMVNIACQVIDLVNQISGKEMNSLDCFERSSLELKEIIVSFFQAL